jgi:hypothetical protein
MVNNPFFILANPRSGSSLLRIILDCNSNITVPPECGFLLWWFEKYKSWDSSNTLNKNDINTFVADIQSSKKFSTWKCSDRIIINEIVKKKPSNVQELFISVYKSYENKRGKTNTVIGDKNNYYVKHLDALNGIYENAKYIHLVRDGRDVAASYQELDSLNSSSEFKPNLSFDIVEIAREWNDNNESIHDFLLKRKKECSVTIRFEDLILDTERTCREIVAFLGVEFDLDMLNYFNLNAKLGLEPKETLDWKKKTLSPIDKNVVGRHTKIFENHDDNDFFKEGMFMLKRYGYVQG